MTTARHRTLTLHAPTAEAMQRFGEALGRQMRAGDTLALTGPLGAGKTTFCQGLARGLDVAPERAVTSPTFSLVNVHPGRLTFAHADLYRLKSEAELEELGLEELMDEGAVAVEWAERFPRLVPADHLAVTLIPADDGGRALLFEAHGPRSEALLSSLAPAAPRA